MNLISISALLGFLLLAITAFYPTKKNLVKKYNKMEEKNLIHANIFAKKIYQLSLVVVFIIIPVVMGLIMPIFLDKVVRNILTSLFVLAIPLGIAVFGIFWRIHGITEAVLQYRRENNPR